MRKMILTITALITASAFQATAAPRVRTVNQEDQSTVSAPRRRAISSKRSSRHRVSGERRARRRAEKRSSRRVERRSERRVERSSKRRVSRHSRRSESRRRLAERRRARRGERSIRRSTSPRRARPYRRRHRPLPGYVLSRPDLTVHVRPVFRGTNDDHFFDELYHDGSHYGINGNLTDELHRIDQGVRRGLITPREERRLRDMLLDIYALEDECTLDGYLSEDEEADLYWAERDLNRAIRWETRDFDTW